MFLGCCILSFFLILKPVTRRRETSTEACNMGSSLSLAVRKKKEKKTLVVLPEITEEMLIDILIRLPAKSLMRFKCVSKIWLSLITSRYFANRFLIKPSPSRCFFAYLVDCENQRKCLLLKSSSSSHDHSDISVSVIDQHSTMPVMGGYFVNSVHGLLCYRTRRRVKVCNPSTRQVVEFPLMRSTNVWHCFEHDPVHDKYKVLSLVWEVNKEERVVRSEHQVLVLGDGATWRNTQSHNDTPHGPFYPHSQGMTINGVLYYIAWTDEDRGVLMSFDLSSEEFNLIELLPYENLSCTSLINYQGKVATCEDTLLSSDGIVDVCVLEDADKSQWSNKKTFVLPVSQMNFVHGDRLVIGGTRDSGKVLLTKENLKPNAPALFFIYDLERNEITRRIEIRPSLRDSFKETNKFLIVFWEHIDSIMYLKT